MKTFMAGWADGVFWVDNPPASPSSDGLEDLLFWTEVVRFAKEKQEREISALKGRRSLRAIGEAAGVSYQKIWTIFNSTEGK